MFFVSSEINSYCTKEVELEPEWGRRASGAMGGNDFRQWSRRRGHSYLKGFTCHQKLWYKFMVWYWGRWSRWNFSQYYLKEIIIERLCKHSRRISFFPTVASHVDLISWAVCLCIFPFQFALWLPFNILPSAGRRGRTSHFFGWQTFSSSVRTVCLFPKCLVTQDKCPYATSFFSCKIRKIDLKIISLFLKQIYMSNRVGFQR